MLFEAVDVVRVRGNTDGILSEERITGQLLFVPHPDGTASIMLPISYLIEEAKEARRGGLIETPPLGRADMHKRRILSLGKREVQRVWGLQIGEEIVFARKGWGKTSRQRLRRIEEAIGGETS